HPDGLEMKLSSGAFECKAFVREHLAEPLNLIDAEVSIHGVFGGVYDPNFSLIGFQVLAPDWGEVRILKKPPQELFSLPLRPVRHFLRLTPEGTFTHRVHVRGTVLVQRPGRFLSIRDRGEALWIRSEQRLQVKPGDIVDAVGFPVIGEYASAMQ